MAHIKYPEDYIESSELFKKVKKKHDTDAATPTGSVLTQFLNEQGIDLDDDEDMVNDADAAHTEFSDNDKLSEEKREVRDNLFNPAMSLHRDMVQFLKRLKRGKVHELGDWGVTISNEDRIDYPSDFLTMRLAMKAFIDKHNTYTTPPSPLAPYLAEHLSIDLAQTLTDLVNSLTAHNDFVQANNDAEEKRELRDVKFDMPYKHILGIGQFLMGLFNDTPHKLGEWGFTIDEHTQLRLRQFTLDPGQQLDLKKLAIGTKVTVIGEGSISINTKSILPSLKGTRAITNKDNPFTVKYGFGSSTIENLSSTAKVTFSAYFTH